MRQNIIDREERKEKFLGYIQTPSSVSILSALQITNVRFGRGTQHTDKRIELWFCERAEHTTTCIRKRQKYVSTKATCAGTQKSKQVKTRYNDNTNVQISFASCEWRMNELTDVPGQLRRTWNYPQLIVELAEEAVSSNKRWKPNKDVKRDAEGTVLPGQKRWIVEDDTQPADLTTFTYQ